MSLAPVLARAMAPLKMLAAALMLMAPLVGAGLLLVVVAVTVRLPPGIEAAPRRSALLLIRLISLALVLARPTAPLKRLAAALRLMAPLVALKLAAPLTLRAVLAAWVM